MAESVTWDSHWSTSSWAPYLDCASTILHNAVHNDKRYLPGDCPLENEQSGARRKKKVEFHQMKSPDNTSDFQSQCLLSLRTLRIMKYDKELQVDNGTSYNFESYKCKNTRILITWISESIVLERFYFIQEHRCHESEQEVWSLHMQFKSNSLSWNTVFFSTWIALMDHC